MIVINEWLPNPTGIDTNEWIELYNSGATPVNLAGWRIETSSGKKTFLSGAIQPAEYKVFYKKDYKFVFRNIDESVALYNASGARVDSTGFSGQAISGKSYSRQPDNSFIITDPTPGAKNIENSALALINNSFPYNQPITPPAFSTGQIFLLAVAAGVLCAGVSRYIIKNHEDLSILFFSRDEKDSGDNREEAGPACPPKRREGREPAEGDFAF